jgi:Homeodomain-like domain
VAAHRGCDRAEDRPHPGTDPLQGRGHAHAHRAPAPPFTQSRFTPAETLAAIDQLLDTHTDAEVAAQLNARGYHSFAGLPFQATHVSQLRRAHGLKDRCTRLRDAGMRTAAEVAAHLGVSEQTVWRWYHRGWIMGARYNDRGTCVFVPPETVPPRSRRRRVGTLKRL